MLVRDRDALSGALTLEVAHEALLSEWERLRRWIDDGRDDLRQHAAYSLAVDDWLTAGRDHDYLLTGGRLEQFEQWRATTTMRLTASEREFLDDAVRRRDDAEAAEIDAGRRAGAIASPGPPPGVRARRRGGSDRGGARSSRSIAAAGTGRRAGSPSSPRATPADDEPAALYEQGLVRAERDFDLDVERRGPATSDASSPTSQRVTTIS